MEKLILLLFISTSFMGCGISDYWRLNTYAINLIVSLTSGLKGFQYGYSFYTLQQEANFLKLIWTKMKG